MKPNFIETFQIQQLDLHYKQYQKNQLQRPKLKKSDPVF